ncbi:cobalt ABC transporter permease [Campylobacter sp. RM12920]|uniref:Cobalt ABC transporter permease n=1 Tax=Campylobacter californiensis TaxID=1032243 RepID=A0ABD4JLC7_9BACT|nr:cobalt ABC transporter permease [Campylobacter sp. RM12919]MBE2988920.1 cobalt ABC transporter permease [Campylobacter sp. RM12920]
MNSSIKIISFSIFSIFVALSSTIYASFLLPLLLLFALNFSIIFAVIKMVVFLNLFIVFVALSVMLSQNYDLALLIFIRSNLILLFGGLLFYGANYYDIARGVSGLRLGGKVSYLVYFSIRFIEMLTSELSRIKMTLKARAFVRKTSLFTYETYANVVAMLFLKAFHSANMLEKAMITRGFECKFYELDGAKKIGFYDIILFASVLVAVIFRVGVLV